MSDKPKVDYLKLIGGTSLQSEIEKEDHSYLNPPKLEAKKDPNSMSPRELLDAIQAKRHLMRKYMPKKWVKVVKSFAHLPDPETDEAKALAKNLVKAGFLPEDFMFNAALVNAMKSAQQAVLKKHGTVMSPAEAMLALTVYTGWPAKDCEGFYNDWMTPEAALDNPFANGDEDENS